MADYSSLINGYFNSLFGRDAKEDGLAYWSDALNDPNSGVTIDNLEQSLISGAASSDLAYYNQQLVTNSFNDLFGRDPADAGLDYYTTALSDPTSGVTSGNIQETILNGASETDQAQNNYITATGDNPASGGTSGSSSGSSTTTFASVDPSSWSSSELSNPFPQNNTNTPTYSGQEYGDIVGTSAPTSVNTTQATDPSYWQGILSSAEPQAIATSSNSSAADTPTYSGQEYANIVGTSAPTSVNTTQATDPSYWQGILSSASLPSVSMDDPSVSLSTVTPYDPSTAVFDTGYHVSDSYSNPYWRPSESETVEGRLNNLLSENSTYMQSARASGERTAQSRGLLNSSLAAGASQQAAIEAGLPIAQQDSTSMVNAGMAGYQGQIQGALNTQQGSIEGELARQSYEQSLGGIAAQEAASSRLSAQEATQSQQMAQFQSLLDSGLSAQDAAQQAGLSEQEANQALQSYQYQGLISSGLSAQDAAQQAELSEQEANQVVQLSQFQALLESGLSAQEAAQQAGLSEQEANQALQLAQYQGLITSGLLAQEGSQDQALSQYQAGASSDLSYQEYLQEFSLGELSGTITSNLSTQEHEQDMELDWQQMSGYNYRTELEAEMNLQVAQLNLSSNETTSFASSLTEFGEKFQNDLTGINVSTELNDEEKTYAIAAAQAAYEANLQYLGSTYGIEVTWDSIDTTSAGEALDNEQNTTDTETETETETGENTSGSLEGFFNS